MPSIALGLLIASAGLHAAWNLLLKQSAEKYMATWWALVAGSLCFLPLLFLGGTFSLRALPLAALSALAETAYFICLAAAYRQADFSLVYPIARGAAPALLAVWSILFLGERPSIGGLAGLAILTGGLMTIGASGLARAPSAARQAGVAAQPRVAAHWGSVGLALGVALCISIYSVVDGRAVRFTDPIPYMVVAFMLTTLFSTPFMFKYYGWQKLRAGWRAERWRAPAIGVLTLAAYGLVLAAYKIAPVSYGGAIREVSIVFGVLAGWLWLGEGFGRVRLLGSLAVVAGLVVIAMIG